MGHDLDGSLAEDPDESDRGADDLPGRGAQQLRGIQQEAVHVGLTEPDVEQLGGAFGQLQLWIRVV
jgi:hypothetical protein